MACGAPAVLRCPPTCALRNSQSDVGGGGTGYGALRSQARLHHAPSSILEHASFVFEYCSMRSSAPPRQLVRSWGRDVQKVKCIKM